MTPVAWSFEDEVWQGLRDAAARRIPLGGEHSIAWLVRHSTRIEDVRRPVAEPALRALLADGSVTADAMDLLYDWGSLNCAGFL